MKTERQQQLRGIYAITPALPDTSELLHKAEQAIAGGISLLQYRNKQADAALQQQQAGALVQLCRQHQVMLLVNDNIALAQQVDADGVHLGQRDGDVAVARQQLGDNKIIGVTCHSDIRLALQAQQQGADYAAFGRFFPSHSKPDAPAADLAVLQDAQQQLGIAVVAIGGITPATAPALLDAGADMLAVIHAIFGQPDIHHASREFADIFQQMTAPER